MTEEATGLHPPPRILVTKIGLDGHDRGSRLVASFLRDAGMEVIYTPPWQEIETVIKTVAEEDVEVVGVSSLATDHLLLPKLVTALRAAGLDHVQVAVGGIIPEADIPGLTDAGVAMIFHPGAGRSEVVEGIAELVGRARAGGNLEEKIAR